MFLPDTLDNNIEVKVQKDIMKNLINGTLLMFNWYKDAIMAF